MSEKEFVSGLYWNDPSEKAPDFVKGRISVNAEKFADWLSQQQRSEKGYVNMQVLRKRDGSGYYAVLDDWKPQQARSERDDVSPAEQKRNAYRDAKEGHYRPERTQFDDDAEIPF